MRTFRASYTDKCGQKRIAQKWYLELRDGLGMVRRLAGFSDKRVTEEFGRNIEALINCRIAGIEPDAKLNRWVQDVPGHILHKFFAWGLIDAQRTENAKPLAVHTADYIDNLRARDNCRDYIVRTQNRLKRIFADCRFIYFRDITRSAVETYMGRLKAEGYGDTSRGHYLGALTSFLNWAQHDQRILINVLSGLEKPRRDSQKKGVLTPEQFVCLVKTTAEKNILVGRVTGAERATLYLFAGTSGLRRNELLGLRWSDIVLSNGNGFVRVPATLSKNRRECRQPLPPATMAVLAAWQAQGAKKDTDRVFGLSRHINTATLLRTDLPGANIEPTDRDGNEICFHSLRNSYISFLANSMTPPKVVQQLARHADPRLTFNTYARSFADAEQKAMNNLPNVIDNLDTTNPQSKNSALCLARQDAFRCNSVRFGAERNGDNGSETAFLMQDSIPPRGVEPLSPG